MAGEGRVVVRLDSIDPGSAYNNVPGTYYLTIQPGQPSESQASFQVLVGQTFDSHEGSASFSAAPVDPAAAANFGVPTDFVLGASVTSYMPGSYFLSSQGRACVNGALGDYSGFANEAGANECSYNGMRWFDGPSPANNETTPDPTAGNMEINNFGSIPTTLPSYNNAGALTGVITVYEPRSYLTVQSLFRGVEGIMSFSARAADFNVYWGANGVVDSVIDVTHNVVVPFGTEAAGNWGFLNASNTSAAGSRDGRPGVVSLYDFACVAPLRNFSQGGIGGACQVPAETPYQLAPVAELSPIALISGSNLAADHVCLLEVALDDRERQVRGE